MHTSTYRVIIEPDGRYFHAYVPALPGCHTFGKTLAETKKNVREAIQVYLESLLLDRQPIPTDYNSFEYHETIELKKQLVYA